MKSLAVTTTDTRGCNHDFTRIWYHLYPKVTGNLNTLLDWLILQAILTIYREGNLDQVSHKSASFSEF